MFRFACIKESNNFIKNKLALHISEIKYLCERRKSYYQALGLDSTASAKDIKAAYYKLSLKFHPDRNMEREESVAKFREITEAYEVLGNPEKKRRYDQECHFYPNYYSKYSETGQFYRSSNRRGPFRGRSKDFNYDEHFRQHYQDRQREIEYEYFRRTWDADFNRRYKDFNDYYQNRDKNDESMSDFSRRVTLRRSPYPVLFVVFILLLIIYIFQTISHPDFHRKHAPLYYKVSNEDDESKDDQI